MLYNIAVARKAERPGRLVCKLARKTHERTMGQKGQTFLTGALILSVMGLLVKIVGAFYKIPLTNIIGDVAMAEFTFAYSIYATMFILASSGLSSTVSKMVATSRAQGRYRESHGILKTAISTYSVFGLFISVAVIIFADKLVALFNWEGSSLAVRAVAFAVFFASISSAFKGYFQGNRNMWPTGIANLIEAVGKLVVGFSAALFLKSTGASNLYIASGAVFGVTCGTALSAASMYIWYRINRRGERQLLAHDISPVTGRRRLVRSFLKNAVPITLSSFLLTFINQLDGFIMKSQLEKLPQFAGLDPALRSESAKALYSVYVNKALSIFNMPSVVIMTVAISSLPFIASSFATGNHAKTRSTMNSSMRILAMLAMAAGMGMSFMAHPILDLLYAGDVEVAARALRIIGPGLFFVNMSQLTTAILQAVGKQNLPFFHVMAGGLVKLTVNYTLVQRVGVTGAPVGTILCFAIVTVLNINAIRRATGIMPNIYRVFLKPAAAGVGCGASAHIVYRLSSFIVDERIATVFGLLAGVAAFALLVLFLRVLTKDDIKMLPFAQKYIKTLEKRGWIS